MEDKKILTLIELSVDDPNRRELYAQSLTNMTADEKVDFTLSLYSLMMAKLHEQTVGKMEEMITEMAQDGSTVQYEQKDFQDVHDNVVNKYLQDRLGVDDADRLSELRAELSEIGQIVNNHDLEINDIKSRLN